MFANVGSILDASWHSKTEPKRSKIDAETKSKIECFFERPLGAPSFRTTVAQAGALADFWGGPAACAEPLGENLEGVGRSRKDAGNEKLPTPSPGGGQRI